METYEPLLATMSAMLTGGALAWIVGRVHESKLENRLRIERARNAELQELVHETTAELRRAITQQQNTPPDSGWRMEP